MGYFLNDFTGLLIGALVVFTTFEVAKRMTPNRLTVADVPVEYSMLFVIVPVIVWYLYYALLSIGPKGTSKAIKL